MNIFGMNREPDAGATVAMQDGSIPSYCFKHVSTFLKFCIEKVRTVLARPYLEDKKLGLPPPLTPRNRAVYVVKTQGSRMINPLIIGGCAGGIVGLIPGVVVGAPIGFAVSAAVSIVQKLVNCTRGANYYVPYDWIKEAVGIGSVICGLISVGLGTCVAACLSAVYLPISLVFFLPSDIREARTTDELLVEKPLCMLHFLLAPEYPASLGEAFSSFPWEGEGCNAINNPALAMSSIDHVFRKKSLEYHPDKALQRLEKKPEGMSEAEWQTQCDDQFKKLERCRETLRLVARFKRAQCW